MRHFIHKESFLVLFLLISACSWHRSDTGTAAGAVAGGLVGNALTGSTAGTIIGAVGGGYAGRQLAR